MNPPLRSGHPRVLVSPEDLPLLRERARTTHKAEMESLLALAESCPGTPDFDRAILGPHTLEGARSKSLADNTLTAGDPAQIAFRLAFLYLLTGEKTHAAACERAIDAVMQQPVDGRYSIGSVRLRALACAYDWCHNALPEITRRLIAHRALSYAHVLYSNGEVWPNNYVAGHDVNSLPPILMAAIGMSGEIFGADALLADALRHTEGMLGCYKYFLEHDSFPQSYSYTGTYMFEIPCYFQLLQTAYGRDCFAENPWFRNCVQWWTYALRDDEAFLRYGDHFGASRIFTWLGYYRGLAAIASRYRDGLANWWVKQCNVSNIEPDQILFEDRTFNEIIEPSELPRTKLFSGMGIAIARGDFAGGTVAALKCSPIYLHNHCHRDQNQITVYHKGDLAIDSGHYDDYESPHWYNYYIRSIAHNTIVVHDPQEQFLSRGATFANDGGQRFINEPDFAPRTLEDLSSEAWRDGSIAAYQEGNGWSYVCGEASHCYSPQKLKQFMRHVVFVLDWPRKTCVSLVVLDEVELARPGLLPRYLLHTVSEPEVSGNRIVARHRGGRLTTHVLLPGTAEIEKIGGPGKEFWCDGRNWPLKLVMQGNHVPGSWRVEVAPPAAGSTRVRFVTLLVPADADAPQEPVPTLQDFGDDGVVVSQGALSVLMLKASAGGKQIAGVPKPVEDRREPIVVTLK
ncbi:MAG TPA: heparinase II/III family protein [Planctomycetota bacterium]|jgi:hypothetical protein